jgi:hypothetical protein
MLPLIKRSDATPIAAPNWHPNFRNYERLPDTKVVRTTFFVNVIAITVATCCALLVGFWLYRMHELGVQLEETQAIIDKNSKENAEVLRLTAIFNEEQKKADAALAFTKRTVVPSEFLMFLAANLPKEVQIESTDLRFSGAGGDQCVLRGIVAGSKDAASGSANKYVESLRNPAISGDKFASVDIASLNPDPSGGYLRFEILIKFKTSGKGK